MPNPDWRLAWHHLSATICLTRSSGSPGTTFRGKLKVLPPDALRDALAADQSGAFTEQRGLFKYVRQYRPPSKPGYEWDPNVLPWPPGLPLRIRDGAPDIVLGPNALTIPFPGDRELKQNFTAAGGQIVAWNAATDFDATTDLWLDVFMRAADDAVRPGSPHRGPFETGGPKGGKVGCQTTSDDTKRWIVKQVIDEYEYNGPAYPTPLKACVNDAATTRQTLWEGYTSNVSPAYLRLVLGWTEDTRVCQPVGLLARLYQLLLSLLRALGLLPEPRIDSWPCGAFCGY